MENYEHRVEDEKTELDIKLTKLQTFMSSKEFDKVSLKEKQLLIRQQLLMNEYSTILRSRIELFQELKAKIFEDKEK